MENSLKVDLENDRLYYFVLFFFFIEPNKQTKYMYNLRQKQNYIGSRAKGMTSRYLDCPYHIYNLVVSPC